MSTITTVTQRKLASRIGRFLDGIDHQKREPNRVESHYVLDALAYLKSEHFELGEEAMRQAERSMRPDEGQVRQVRPSVDPISVASLRDSLTEMLHGVG